MPIKCEPIFNPANTFNPGTANAPWSGFSTNINTESQLRNQFFALQRNDQAEYISVEKDGPFKPDAYRY